MNQDNIFNPTTHEEAVKLTEYLNSQFPDADIRNSIAKLCFPELESPERAPSRETLEESDEYKQASKQMRKALYYHNLTTSALIEAQNNQKINTNRIEGIKLMEQHGWKYFSVNSELESDQGSWEKYFVGNDAEKQTLIERFPHLTLYDTAED